MSDQRTDSSRAAGKSPDAKGSRRADDVSRPSVEPGATAKSGAEAAEAVANEVAAATHRTLDVATEIAEAGSAAAQQTLQSGLDMATQVTEQVARTFGLQGHDSAETTRHLTQNARVLMDCGTVIAHGLQDISRELLDQSQGRLQRSFDSVGALLRARTPQDAVTIQGDIARETLRDVIEGSRLASERMVSLTDEVMRVMTVQDRVGA